MPIADGVKLIVAIPAESVVALAIRFVSFQLKVICFPSMAGVNVAVNVKFSPR